MCDKEQFENAEVVVGCSDVGFKRITFDDESERLNMDYEENPHHPPAYLEFPWIDDEELHLINKCIFLDSNQEERTSTQEGQRLPILVHPHLINGLYIPRLPKPRTPRLAAKFGFDCHGNPVALLVTVHSPFPFVNTLHHEGCYHVMKGEAPDSFYWQTLGETVEFIGQLDIQAKIVAVGPAFHGTNKVAFRVRSFYVNRNTAIEPRRIIYSDWSRPAIIQPKKVEDVVFERTCHPASASRG